MTHSNRAMLIGAAIIAAVLIAVGSSGYALVPLVFVVICPLMMFMMMRGMTGNHLPEDHSGHGCEHDPARKDEVHAGPLR